MLSVVKPSDALVAMMDGIPIAEEFSPIPGAFISALASSYPFAVGVSQGSREVPMNRSLNLPPHVPVHEHTNVAVSMGSAEIRGSKP